jgi:hypothetical protein
MISMIGFKFQQIPFGDFSREGLTGAKFGVKIRTVIGGSCLGLLQTETMSTSRLTRKKSFVMKQNKQSMKQNKQVVL